MSDGADFVSDLNNLPEGVVPASSGSVETHRGGDNVAPNAQPEVLDPGTAAEQAKTPTSLRDQISSALKEEATPDAAKLDGGMVRNPDGTFAPKPADQITDPNAPAAAADGTVQYPQQAIPGLDAATFATLPAETQQAVARTMETLDQQRVQFAALAQIEQVIAPRRQAWALNGMTEGQVLNQLFALSDFANQDAPGFIRYIAQQNGVDLEELAFGTDPVDPITAAQDQRIRELETQLQGITTQQQQAAHQNVVDEIVQFANEKAADGKTVLRPYLEELGASYLPFIDQAIKANPNRPRPVILQEAYDTACWANPGVRTKLLAAQAATAEAERIKAQTEAAARARGAGVSIPSGTPGEGAGTKAASTGDLRDDIRASIAAAT